LPDQATVRPGAYTLADPSSGEPYTVVWWDPLLLDTPADDNRGLRREDLIAKDARAEDVAADLARYDTWRARRQQIADRAAQPSLSVVTATEWAKTAERGTVPKMAESARIDEIAKSVHVEDAGLAARRPTGKRFGVLVHAILAVVPLDGSDEQVGELARLHARILGATDDERDHAAQIVTRVLRHPVIAEARAATVIRREAPVSIVLDGVLVDGQVDLAYQAAEGWTVVDFKTDAELGAAEAAYRRQLGLYAHAIAHVSSRPARGILLRV
jgi:ATP-dependent exoDNAse (exonuclease V) beta subunit